MGTRYEERAGAALLPQLLLNLPQSLDLPLFSQGLLDQIFDLLGVQNFAARLGQETR